jgi:hypothetical protein
VFAVKPISYQLFLNWSVAIALALSGGLTASMLYSTSKVSSSSAKRSLAIAITLATAVALLILVSWTATGWLVSGMENSLILFLGATIVYLAVRSSASIWHILLFAIALGLFGAARTEFPLFMGPLLAAVGYQMWRHTQRARRRAALLLVLGIPVMFWGILILAGYAYFGHLLPNTAIVEGKKIGVIQILFLAALTIGAVGFAMVAVLGVLGVRAKRWAWITVGLLSGVAFVAFVLLSGTPTSPTKYGFKELLIVPVLTGSLAFAMLRLDRHSPDEWTPDLVFVGLVFIPFAQRAVMGPARLDQFRILSLSVPFLVLWIAATLARLISISRQKRTESQQKGWTTPTLTAIGVTMLLCLGLIWADAHDPPRDLCCFISPNETQILSVSNSLQRNELGGKALPIVANADLGKISFAKQAIIEDIGWLGDPLLAQIYLSRPDLVALYLNEVADPDVVATHQYWSCAYESWIRSPQFQSSYVLVKSWNIGPGYMSCPPRGYSAIWQRSVPADEYRLTRLISTTSDPVKIVRLAISSCRKGGGGIFRCEYVRRAILRNAQTLIDRGLLIPVLADLKTSPSASLDIPLLSQQSGWDTKAFNAFVELAAPTSGRA